MSFVKGVEADLILLGPTDFHLTCFDMNWTTENAMDLRHNLYFFNWLVKAITHIQRAPELHWVQKKKNPERVFIVKLRLVTCYVH